MEESKKQILLEAQITGADSGHITAALRADSALTVTAQRKSRSADPATVLAIAGGVITLINSIIQLAQTLREKDEKVIVIIKSFEGKTLSLNEATDDEIKKYVEDAEAADL